MRERLALSAHARARYCTRNRAYARAMAMASTRNAIAIFYSSVSDSETCYMGFKYPAMVYHGLSPKMSYNRF